jgi:ubiquinol-cytochrome c reductase cytochrome c1 subunit
MKKFIFLITLTLFSTQAWASSESTTSALHPKKLNWQFEGFFGSFDKQSVQRGYQVYKEVCAACHSMNLVAYRNLQEIGFSEAEVKQIASEYMVIDGPDDSGEMFERPALPSDRFVSPYPNEQAARAANGGAYPPDLSLMVKARHSGANYIYSLLNGYQEAPEDFALTEGKYYNPYFAGRQISMPPPLADDGAVEYKDGTVATKEQMSIDVVNFLQFAAEPEMEHRKQMGVKAMVFLAIMTILFIIAKKLVWRKIK